MAGRPPKQGIDFAGWNVDMFDSDEKITQLIASQGWQGFAIYFYICQRAYGTEGYFYRWTERSAAAIAGKMGYGVKPGMVSATVRACVNFDLFNKRLFEAGILTSRGLQRRFVVATTGRRVRNACRSYWLLPPGESGGMNLISPENTHDAKYATLDAETVTALPDEAGNRHITGKPIAETATPGWESATALPVEESPREACAEPTTPDAETVTALQCEARLHEAAPKPRKRACKKSVPLDAETVTALPDDSHLHGANSMKSGICNEQIKANGNLQAANAREMQKSVNLQSANGHLRAANSPETPQNNIVPSLSHGKEKERDTVGVGVGCNCYDLPLNPFAEENDENISPVYVDHILVHAREDLVHMDYYNEEELLSFRDQLPDEVIDLAISEACAQGKRTYAYVRGILNRCVEKEIVTAGDFKAAIAANKKKKRGMRDGKSGNDGDEEPRKLFDGQIIV